MELPTRILTGPTSEPVITVDGLSSAPGLDLSHWPGNTTPRALRHDLSTGCALAYARLSPSERARLAGDAVAIANNHYDTDGALAMFAARHPDRALPHAERMLAVAAAGDFFRWPDDDALALDAVILGLSDPERSPLRDRFAQRDDAGRWECCLEFLLDAFPSLLEGDLAPYRDLWEPVLERARADRADLERSEREEDPRRDLTTWTAAAGSEAFAPGRHALFGSTLADRVLAIGPRSEGTSYRLVVSTLSWFDLETEKRLPRPDLLALATRLNALEGTGPEDERAWRAQPLSNASPELWFGGKELDSFAEHNGALGLSRLSPEVVRAEIDRGCHTEPGSKPN